MLGARIFSARTEKPYRMGRISTVDLLVLTSLNELLFKLKLNFLFYKATYLNEEVNCTEPSPSVRVPWLGASSLTVAKADDMIHSEK